MTHDEMQENRRKSQERINRDEYDVFVSYNHQDRERVLETCKLLKDNGLAPFFDERDLKPGRPWQRALEQQIKTVKAAAIFVGQAGIGCWQRKEVEEFELEFQERNIPVIPVLLPDISSTRELPLFLKSMHWIDFRKRDPDPLERLIYGITGKHPEKVYRPGVLIASLGDSPVVVSAMYDLLTDPEHEGLTLDRVTVLCPKPKHDDEAQVAYELVKESLSGEQSLHLRYEGLDFKDADSLQNARSFLHKLVRLLDEHQQRGDTVYLSLAGGRKSMAALMAWVTPFFPCVKGLYHVIDKREELFLSAYQIRAKAATLRTQLMHPPIGQLSLVEIPFERGEPMSESRLEKWLSSRPTDYEEEESVLNARAILQQGDIPQVNITRRLSEQFRELCECNKEYARVVRNGLLALGNTATLRDHETKAGAYSYRPPKFQRITLHAYTDLPVPVHPIFYTLPGDIYADPHDKIEQVVVCALETPNANGYRALNEIARSPDFTHEYFSSIDRLPSVPHKVESILVVPLGQSPMVVTQLFTLLREQEQHDIREVVLIYPKLATRIDNSAKLLKQALAREAKDVTCTLVPLAGLKDIASKEDCQQYQEQLEIEIARFRQDQKYRGMKIDLALSGGRKGMTAMTMFAAQKNHIPYVYHTLITDEQTNEAIDQETSYNDLMKTNLSSDERQARLFLRAYKTEGPDPYVHFTLFRVPVFSADSSIEEE